MSSELSDILEREDMLRLFAMVPRRYQIYSWSRVYSLLQDGTGLRNFFSCVQNDAEQVYDDPEVKPRFQDPEDELEPVTLIIIRSLSNKVFGGFATSAWKPSQTFYGLGDCFVWTFQGGPVFPSFWFLRSTES